ncbi:MAG: squalene synthase HpnC [Alphaproteobacteria bacterium]|nr:squalene synthase HpnC [Alphaproteobacteria bacterium]
MERTRSAARTGVTTALETPSGKDASGENFPVGSFLIRRDLRRHVHTFYKFARAADDIADNPALAAADKIRRLDRMAEILEGAPGEDAPTASAMRASLGETGVTPQHCHDILRAFRLDATKLRYEDWDDLMGYCRYSAAPVGRQLIDLHGEDTGAYPPSDALCAALQILNHLQDCVADLRALDRVYLPRASLAANGSSIADLHGAQASPGLRRTFDTLLDKTEELIDHARGLPAAIVSLGLRCESAGIVDLASRLAAHLRRGDPLAVRVKLTPRDFAAAFATGLWRGIAARRRH